MQSVRDKFKTMKKSEAGVDQISTDSKPGTSKQNNDLNTKPNTQELNIQSSEHIDEPMETDFCGPSLPPQLGQSVQSKHGSDPNGLDHTSKQSKQPTWVYLVKAKKSTWTKGNIRFGLSMFHSHPLQRNQSPLCQLKSLLSPRGLLLSKANSKQIQTSFL